MNTFDSYEPDNRVFRSILLMSLGLVFTFLYYAYKLNTADTLKFYDWMLVGIPGAGMIHLLKLTKSREDQSE
jgi:hypothetical protein